jgi:hypothetical protein
MKNVFTLSTLLLSLNLHSQKAQKLESYVGFNTAYTLMIEKDFFSGFQIGLQTAVPNVRKGNRFFIFGIDYNYFAIKTIRKTSNPHLDDVTIKSDNVFGIFTLGSRITFKNKSDNFFQWAIALNLSSQGGFGIGPKISLGYKLIDREKHKFFLSPLIGLNLLHPGNESIAMPIYSYASVRMIYQFSKE